MELVVFRHSTESDSPLSRVVLTNDIVSAHPHQWLFAQGASRSVKSIGWGRQIRPAACSEEFAGVVLALHGHGHHAFRDRILGGALDPKSSAYIRVCVERSEAATMTAEELQDWIATESKELDAFSPMDPTR